MTAPSMVDLINRKKVGEELGRSEIDWICSGYVAEAIPDYQMSAWLMAVRLVGLSSRETLDLTEALVATGETVSWPTDRPVVDKHSTGGVGDKTSIALVPLMAAAGIWCPKMSGRGLGHTGGTLDKLEAIPGFRVDLTLDEMRRQVEEIGCAIVGQTPQLVPGDGAIYALRDVTGTVDSIPLIASSIMSKKLALGAPSIVLDVKWGSGAILRDETSAIELAEAMVRIGDGAGRAIRAVMTPMDAPLGRAIGNSVEIAEAVSILHGDGPDDLQELVLELGAQMMVTAGATPSVQDARRAIGSLIGSGLAVRKLAEMIEHQGGDPSIAEDPDRLPTATERLEVTALASGYVGAIDAHGIAQAALELGAGRRQKADRVDPLAGVVLDVAPGSAVSKGDRIATLLTSEAGKLAAAEKVARRAIDIRGEAAEIPPRRDRVITPADLA